jgi:hypothetical protein
LRNNSFIFFELLDDFAGAEQGALGRTQGSVSFVDRHQKVVVLAIKVHLPKIGDPLAIALGTFGHHGKFGGNCGQIGIWHGITICHGLAK